MRILVLAEHDNRSLKPASLAAITAAQVFNGKVDILIAGYRCSDVAKNAAYLQGVDSIRLCDDAIFTNPLAETLTELMLTIADDYDVILCAATAFGKNVMPRLSALRDVQQVSDVIEILSHDTFIRPIYAGNALSTVKAAKGQIILTIRPTAFKPAKAQDQEATISNIPAVEQTKIAKFLECRVTESVRPELTTANIIVAGGRGIGSDHAFNLISQLADTLGGAIGASRAAVDSGFISNDAQVGQTGKIVAPDLYIAVGISGAIQHLAGMKDSKIIVAINKDADAPIFQFADYGLVADMFEALPHLIKQLET